MLERHVAQVRLLVDVLPDIAKEFAFALKGGTAINLFLPGTCRGCPLMLTSPGSRSAIAPRHSATSAAPLTASAR